jgi:hypothetical protein
VLVRRTLGEGGSFAAKEVHSRSSKSDVSSLCGLVTRPEVASTSSRIREARIDDGEQFQPLKELQRTLGRIEMKK